MQVNIQKETNTERHTKVFKGMCYAHFVNGVHMGAISIISKHGINEEFGIGVIFILADRFANLPVKGVL